jgi:hypothetical protein
MPKFVEGTGRTWIVSKWTNSGVYAHLWLCSATSG